MSMQLSIFQFISSRHKVICKSDTTHEVFPEETGGREKETIREHARLPKGKEN